MVLCLEIEGRAYIDVLGNFRMLILWTEFLVKNGIIFVASLYHKVLPME
jgi:hypothetical protein